MEIEFSYLRNALIRCSETAELEYKVALDAIRQAKKIGALISTRMNGDKLEGGLTHLPETLVDLSERIECQSNKVIETASRVLRVKRSRLKKFTVALFGRTMAGKSTLREAITGGDGRSIGKGGQDFTQRLHE